MQNIPHVFRPIDQWPGKPTVNRRRSQFKSSYADTMTLLDRELTHLGASRVVIQLALPESQIRRDGLPYATAQPSHPGVILAFESRQTGPMKFPGDAFDKWIDNLRAIALSLESLRKVDRYGVTRRAEQYRGWSQLPPPGGLVTPVAMTLEEAADYVGKHGGGFTRLVVIQSVEQFQAAYRAAAKKLHPDTGIGGGEWDKLQRAADLLKRKHGTA